MGMCVCSYVHMYIGQIGGVTYGEMGVRDFTSRFELNQRIARDRASSWGVGGGDDPDLHVASGHMPVGALTGLSTAQGS